MDARTDFPLWSERYDRELKDIFEVQDEIARKIAEALRITLTPQERGANHKRWLKAGIPMIQMLTNLQQVGARFTIVALPLKLTGMDGAPARVVGIVE